MSANSGGRLIGKKIFKEVFSKKRKHLHENTHSRALIIPLSSVFQNWWEIRVEKNLCHFIALPRKKKCVDALCMYIIANLLNSLPLETFLAHNENIKNIQI